MRKKERNKSGKGLAQLLCPVDTADDRQRRERASAQSDGGATQPPRSPAAPAAVPSFPFCPFAKTAVAALGESHSNVGAKAGCLPFSAREVRRPGEPFYRVRRLEDTFDQLPLFSFVHSFHGARFVAFNYCLQLRNKTLSHPSWFCRFALARSLTCSAAAAVAVAPASLLESLPPSFPIASLSASAWLRTVDISTSAATEEERQEEENWLQAVQCRATDGEKRKESVYGGNIFSKVTIMPKMARIERNVL